MRVEYNGVCDRGLNRQMNQDKLYMKTKGNTALFVIADGMGGHSHGEKASEHIVKELKNWYEGFDEYSYDGKFDNMVFAIRCVLEQTNGYIHSNFGKNVICGSTVVLIFTYREYYAVVWAGDSRAYQQSGWKFRMLTVDDVWENRPEIKKLSRKLIKDNINCGKLVNAIGTSENVRINIKTDIMKRGSRFLLCSDGLYKMCDEKEMKRMLAGYKGKKSGDAQMQEYLKSVYDKGARDNVSFIIAVYE